jgi:hypothetical protein
VAYDSEITERQRDLLILEKARERIARGWVQHTLCCDRGVCVMGALDSLCADDGTWARCLGALGLSDDGSYGLRPAARWNDAPGRTQAEVLARFDAAISKLSTWSTTDE